MKMNVCGASNRDGGYGLESEGGDQTWNGCGESGGDLRFAHDWRIVFDDSHVTWIDGGIGSAYGVMFESLSHGSYERRDES